MATEKLIRRAKVTLVKGKTYTLPGFKKFIRNVPVTVIGNHCDEFKNNGRFSCVELEAKPVKKKKKLKSSNSESTSTKKKSSKKKSKSSSKKKLK